MAVRQILEVPDPRLREVAIPVEVVDGEIGALVADLVDTLHATSGLGLSAPQLGVARRVLVMDHSAARSAPEVYINPEILSRSTWGIVDESCLSVPGLKANVVRATRVRVRARDQLGEWLERDLEGMPAVCLQHEVDHLDGKLFIDRLSFIERLRLRFLTRQKLPRAA